MARPDGISGIPPVYFTGRKGGSSGRLPLMTCGYPVRKAVENRDHMRITGPILWIRMWIGKMPQKSPVRVLRGDGRAQ